MSDVLARFCPVCGDSKPEIVSKRIHLTKNQRFRCAGCSYEFTVHGAESENQADRFLRAISPEKPREKLTQKKVEELLRERFCQCKEPLPPTERYNPWGRANLEKTVCSACGFRREPTMQHAT